MAAPTADAPLVDVDEEMGEEDAASDHGDDAPGAEPEDPPAPPPLHYDGVSSRIPGLLTRSDLVRQGGTATTEKLERQLAARGAVCFMPVDVHEMADISRGEYTYKLHLFGPLPDGSKAHVILDGIEVYFDVRVRDGADAFEAELRQALAESDDLLPDLIREIEAYPIRGYHSQKARWKRLVYGHTTRRKKAINFLRERGYETASDDLTAYYRMAARVNGFVLTDWAKLREYSYQRGGAHPAGPEGGPKGGAGSPLCEHHFRVDVRHFVPLVDPMASREERERQGEALQRYPALLRDRTLVLGWDIETHTPRKEGDLPVAVNAEDTVFMISASLHWKDEEAPLHQVCLIGGREAAPDARWTTVLCSGQTSLLCGFAVLLRHFAPDIVVGFNDGDYDWPFVLTKAQQAGLLAFYAATTSAIPPWRPTEDGVQRWNIARDKRIKISGGDNSVCVTFFNVPGWVAMDVRVMFMQLFPRAEVGKGSSLDFYLRACNLPLKADMPHTRLWRIYEEGDPVQMRRAAHYCVNDAQRCQALLVKRSVVADRREVATLAYVSFADAVFYAGGHKVQNMVGAFAHRSGLLASHIAPRRDEEHRKYPGAWVFHPQKGLVPDPAAPGVAAMEQVRAFFLSRRAARGGWGAVCPPAALRRIFAFLCGEEEGALPGYRPGRPVTGLDFSSLYPSLIIAYNFSPEKYVGTAEEAARLSEAGRELHPVSFVMQGDRTPIEGWFVRHGEDPSALGLYPRILAELYDQRAALKRRLAVYERVRELMDLAQGQPRSASSYPEELAAAERAAGEADPGERRALEALAGHLREAANAPEDEREGVYQARYRLNDLLARSLDSKQKALKVFMNTFYGEAGNSLSPLFLLPLAGGVTSAGQYNIKLAAAFVEAAGFRLVYGDTDSLYVSCPAAVFAAADAAYALGQLGREEYWGQMVRISMGELDVLRDGVNRHLEADNGTRRLKMAYEEVLYPVVFTGKKKYYGVAHVAEPNFRPKKLFVRGIEVVKQGVSELAKKIGYGIMWQSVAVDNAQTLLAIVERALAGAIENPGQWRFADFVMTECWRPHRNNVAVQNFVGRMRAGVAREAAENAARVARGEEPKAATFWVPAPGERFPYVLRPPRCTHNLQGMRVTPCKGDVMEHAELARAEGMAPDVGRYLRNYVVGLCARFINYAEQFEPPGAASLDEQALDKKVQDAAVKYLTRFVATLSSEDPELVRRHGVAYKAVWKEAVKICKTAARDSLGPLAEVLHGELLDWHLFLPSEEETADRVPFLVEQARLCAVKRLDPRRPCAMAARLGIARDGEDLEPTDGASPASRLYAAARLLTRDGAPRGRPAPSIRDQVFSAFDRREAGIRSRLATQIGLLGDVAMRYEASIAEVVERVRLQTHARVPELGPYTGSAGPSPEEPGLVHFHFALDPEERERLEGLRRSWHALVGVHHARESHRALAAHLVGLKNRRQGHTVPLSSPEVSRTIAAAAQGLAPLGVPLHGGAY